MKTTSNVGRMIMDEHIWDRDPDDQIVVELTLNIRTLRLLKSLMTIKAINGGSSDINDAIMAKIVKLTMHADASTPVVKLSVTPDQKTLSKWR